MHRGVPRDASEIGARAALALAVLLVGACKDPPPPVTAIAVTPVAVAPATTAPPPDDPRFTQLAQAVRDLRSQRPPRASKLLVVEATALEQLFGSTRPTSSDRPQITRRLASTYLEMAQGATSSKEALSPSPPGVIPARSPPPPPPPNVDEVIHHARTKGIALYVQLIGEHPEYSQLDEVLYELGYQYELEGDVAHARATYRDLIENRPDSRFVPDATFALGELSYREDPEAALQSYLAASAMPPPANKVYALALFRVGSVYRNRGDQKKAGEAFRKTLEICASEPRYDRPTPYVPKLSDIVKGSAVGR